jgi:hypothetical protein
MGEGASSPSALSDRGLGGGGGIGLASLEQSIGLQERLVTQQRRVVETAAAARLDAAPSLALLRAMEENLEKMHAWRLRLLGLGESPRPTEAWRRGAGHATLPPHEQQQQSPGPRARPVAAASPDR